MLKTRLSKLLGIEFPIFSAPMGPDIAGPDLAAAVSGAGGLGLMQAQFSPPADLREQIQRVRRTTDKPFGVNFILALPHEENLAVCLEEHVAVISFFWGDATRYVERVHAVGSKVFLQVGSVEAAQRAAAAGVDVIIAQGSEAGGHVEGEVATMVLAPRIVDAVAPLPVAVAGGIADARGVVAALALGAEAVVLGTRFLLTHESNAHPWYKQQLLKAGEKDTVRTILFGHGWPNAPHRTLRTRFVEQWLGNESRTQESRPDEPVIGKSWIGGREIPIQRFMSTPPNAHVTGDIDSMALLVGQAVGLVKEIKPAATVVRELADGASRLIEQRLGSLVAGV
jgi:NAD(P)H-dependent flavin oxidoreductase YrpB (nitropropane dioxygenase family)